MLDLSLFLGILGVLLTIVFFVIGYRQTIGARRERARAANQALLDTFFRRLALEEKFLLTRSDVAKVISGWAINARVRSSDIHSLQELEDLLSARALESDYIAEGQRQTIGSRISKMFREENTPVFFSQDDSDTHNIRPEVILAIGSGLASMVAAMFAILFVSDKADAAARTLMESVIAPVTILISLTVIVLLAYTRVRDISRPSTDEPTSTRSIEMDLERDFFMAVSRHNKSLKPSINPNFDFTYEDSGEIVGVEIKRDVNRFPRSLLNRVIDRMKSAIQGGLVSRAIIASNVKPNEKVRSLGDENVTIVYLPELLYNLSGNGQCRNDNH